MKFKDMMDPKLWFKSEKDRKIAIAKRDLSGGELEKELASIDGKPYVNVLQIYETHHHKILLDNLWYNKYDIL